MYNLIPLVITVVALGAIIFIVVRKFSVLAALDINTIQAEKEARVKEEIIANRLRRQMVKWSARLKRTSTPVYAGIKESFVWIYQKLQEAKSLPAQDSAAAAEPPEDRLSRLFLEAEEAAKREEWAAAEEKYIAIISQDTKNIKAFRGLGRVYLGRKQNDEARQTLEHIIRLLDEAAGLEGGPIGTENEFLCDDYKAGVYCDLAELFIENGKFADAQGAAEAAVRLCPASPRYLDTLLEISIMNKDKIAALDAWQSLNKANPENSKLAEYKEKIAEL